MHVIDIAIAPPGVDPEAHDAHVRERIALACAEHGEVELNYPSGTPDVARIIDGALIIVAK